MQYGRHPSDFVTLDTWGTEGLVVHLFLFRVCLLFGVIVASRFIVGSQESCDRSTCSANSPYQLEVDTGGASGTYPVSLARVFLGVVRYLKVDEGDLLDRVVAPGGRSFRGGHYTFPDSGASCHRRIKAGHASSSTGGMRSSAMSGYDEDGLARGLNDHFVCWNSLPSITAFATVPRRSTSKSPHSWGLENDSTNFSIACRSRSVGEGKGMPCIPIAAPRSHRFVGRRSRILVLAGAGF